MHKELVEAVAVNDEMLMAHYLDKGELDEDEMCEGLKKSLINRDIIPVFCVPHEMQRKLTETYHAHAITVEP